MGLMDKVHLIPRTLKTDERGWFLKVITGGEENLPPRTGEVYLTMAYPGQVRGNHYHLRTNEWFTVVQGRAVAVVVDVASGEKQEWILDGRDPVTLYVPARVAHAFRSLEKDRNNSMLLVAYADRLYEPADTIPYLLI